MTRPDRPPAVETPLNVDVPTPLWYELNDFCKATRIKKKQFVETAIRKMLREVRENPPVKS